MADLSDLEAAQTVKIAGANSSGIEDSFLEVDSSGRLIVKINDGSGNSLASSTSAPAGTEQALIVRNIPSGTQGISAASLPLPSGASTSALQTTGNTSLSSIDTKTPALGQALAAASTPVVLTAAQLTTLTPLTTVTVTQPTAGNLNATVSIAAAQTLANVTTLGTITNALPTGANVIGSLTNISGTISLPTGASTSALQTTGNTSLSSIDSKTPALGQALAAASVPVVLTAAQLTTLTPLSTIGATQSGTWNINNVSGTVSLPTGASTSALQTTGNTSLSSIVTNTTGIALDSSVNSLLKPASTLAAVTTLGSITNTVVIKADTAVNQTNALKVDGSAVTQPVSAASLPLPAGASTSALQTTGNTSLSSIDTKTPALGQALAAASVPVVLTAAQLSTLTPLTTVAVTQSTSPWVVSGTVTANAGTGSFTVAQATAANLNATVSIAAAQTLANLTTLGTITNPLPTGTNNLGSLTNITGTVSLPTGAATAANQATEITSLQSLDNIVHSQNAALSQGVPLMGQLDDTSTVVATEDNVAVARITAQRAIHSNLRKSDGTEMVGQKTMVNSIPVVLPSDQTITITSSPLPASGSKFAFGRITTAAIPIVPVEQTTYTEQTTNAQRSIASASASDAAAGTGARTITITYYDQTGAGPLTETLTLNGTTGVNTVNTNICFIESVKVATIGSNLSNVGIITLYAAINKGGATIGTIAVGDNQTFWCHHYVPTGKTCFISGFSIGNNSSVAGGGGLFVLKAGTPTVANTVELQVGDFCTISGASNTNTRNYSSPVQVTGPARIKAYVTPYASAAVTQFASFDFIDN